MPSIGGQTTSNQIEARFPRCAQWIMHAKRARLVLNQHARDAFEDHLGHGSLANTPPSIISNFVYGWVSRFQKARPSGVGFLAGVPRAGNWKTSAYDISRYSTR
jgi:hypothetical protein